MLLTITPNPAIDRTLYVPRMTVGAVHRAEKVRRVAGGKGLNVTRAARTLGSDVLATGPLGGYTGRMFANLARAEGLSTDWYWLASGETRNCLLVTHDVGDTTLINEPGPMMSSEDWLGCLAHIRRLAINAQAVAFAGSLPPKIDPEAFTKLARSLATEERLVYLDTSGTALAAALAQPDGLCIKINQTELAAALRMSLVDIEDLVKAGQMLLTHGAALAVVTLGSEGALAITPDGCWHASTPSVEVASTVGSGDSLLAGLAVAQMAGRRIEEALALGVACGAANALTHLPGRFERDVAEVLLEQVGVEWLGDD